MRPWEIQACQVVSMLVFAPLIGGVIAKVEARIQFRTGPSPLQPYYDIAKFFRKESLRPQTASPFFEVAPVIAVAAYCSIALLIPILTSFPLPLGTAGDILGGALLFGLAGFVTALAGVDSGSVYAGIGSSRTQSVATLVEPTLIFVFFTVALVSGTDLPYALNATLQDSASQYFRPSHLLAAAAFFLMLLVDTGRVPIESQTSTLEFGMIDDARLFEHSGPAMALFKWASSMKQFLLYVVFLNVLVVPWGLADARGAGGVLVALLLLLAKMVGLGLVIVVIESSMAKLRLFRIPDFMGAGFVLSVLAILVFYLANG
ncbi:MAG TPA: NADH-quinone oxidoreductase subunit H [Solirubrobacteraceae bacterium]|jgi:formate hydrogenlyase subunit 4